MSTLIIADKDIQKVLDDFDFDSVALWTKREKSELKAEARDSLLAIRKELSRDDCVPYEIGENFRYSVRNKDLDATLIVNSDTDGIFIYMLTLNYIIAHSWSVGLDNARAAKERTAYNSAMELAKEAG